MSKISDIVNQTVPAQHRREPVVGQVITALERAASESADVIRHAARSAGVAAQQVEEVLISAGLVERPAAVTTGSGNTTLAAQVEDLRARLDRAEAAARRHGVRL